MFTTELGIIFAVGGGIVAGILCVAVMRQLRRPQDQRPVEQELFEGLLPSAVTTRSADENPDGERRRAESAGWGVRWAEADTIVPHRAPQRAEAEASTVEASSD